YITIKQIQKYRRMHDVIIKREAKAKLPTKFGDFDIYGYKNIINGEHHIALVMGDVKGENVLCRIHSECLTGDVFGSKRCDCGQQLETALERIGAEGRGVLVYMRQEGRGIGLINKLKAYELQQQGYDTVEANIHLGFEPDLRDYAETAQILKDLGVESICILTNNPHKIGNIGDYGISVADRVAIQVEENDEDIKYLLTKKNKMGHLFTYEDVKKTLI
ncbi:MAG: GTP cyclohydrolase II, partial [Oscillospiraceae bacterium]|nr:GTP cyclohydrolase II [Oscillospiraceae bacterium]